MQPPAPSPPPLEGPAPGPRRMHSGVVPEAMKRVWQLSMAHPLARRMIANYIDGGGLYQPDRTIHLAFEDMRELRARVDITRRSDRATPTQFETILAKMKLDGETTRKVEFSISTARSYLPGTVGSFTANFRGLVTRGEDDAWTFEGSVSFEDDWDFDAAGHRTGYAEVQTTLARNFLIGRPFHVESDWVPVRQDSAGEDAQGPFAAVPALPRVAQTPAARVVTALGGAVFGEETTQQAQQFGQNEGPATTQAEAAED